MGSRSGYGSAPVRPYNLLTLALTPGDRLGVYEVTAPIGAGGMGQVWRARDTTLNRDVALKVLPDSFAQDSDRIARFTREAQTLAALNHPNIASIYGIESNALVMELVEGEDLSERIARGALPLDEALPIAKQLVEALDAAHAQGIVHRDLKPANIKVRADGTVKVLDFGLAKAMAPDSTGASAAAAANSPTITSPAMTQMGVILGTAAYMAPEQARGRAVDKRADIWAFACVLYEMSTGERLFDGEDLAEILASIVKTEPDVSHAPPEIKRLLRKCLEKDRRKRLRDIGDAWDLVDEAGAPPPVTAPQAARTRAWIGWSVAAALAVALAAVAVPYRREMPQPVRHVSLPQPETVGYLVISPDGRQVIMSSRGPGGLTIYSLESGETQALTGTTTARAPFWSPDSRTIGFFADGKLKIMSAAGGPAQTLCDNVGLGAGGTWNASGTILFSTSGGVLMHVSREGGACTVLGLRNPSLPIRRAFPVFLPDGDHFLYYAVSGDDAGQVGVYAGTLEDVSGPRLLADRSSALFVADADGSRTGQLVFIRGATTLVAERFDAQALRLIGDPITVAEHVGYTNSPPQLAASASGHGDLVYVTNGRSEEQLAWYDRTGKALGREAMLGSVSLNMSLAPDGARVVFGRADNEGLPTLWLEDLVRHVESRFTAPPVVPASPVWSPDGRSVAFSTAQPRAGLHVSGLDGGTDRVLLTTVDRVTSSDWSRDGRWLVYTDVDAKTGPDIWLLPDPGLPLTDRKPIPWLRTPATESQGRISPDGQWLAYNSNADGTARVYLRPFAPGGPSTEAQWRVSVESGPVGEPSWRSDSKELFYLSYGALGFSPTFRMMAVPIGHAPSPVGTPTKLFEFPAGIAYVPEANNFTYAPTADGKRFLVAAPATDVKPSIELILNWGSSKVVDTSSR